jgi:hypothetical protein
MGRRISALALLGRAGAVTLVGCGSDDKDK